MLICKGNSNFTCFIFQLNLILSNKLHNLKRSKALSNVIVGESPAMRVRFIRTSITQANSDNSKISSAGDSKSVRSKNLFSDTEAMDYSGGRNNSGFGDRPGSSGVSKPAGGAGGSNSNKESISIDSKATSVTGGTKKVKVQSPKNDEPNFCNNRAGAQFNVQMQQALYLFNGFAQGANVTNYHHQNQIMSPHMFYRSLSDSTPHKQLNSVVCFNSDQREINYAPSRLSRATSTTRQSNVVRFWRQTTLGKILEKKKGCGKFPGKKFKVMSYNVLAQDLLLEHPQLYRQNEPKALKWEHRWRLLFQEIKEHNCDILCLQEVQFEHIENYYNVLKLLGYKGIYKQRTGIRTDGCAIYYKKNVFNLVEHIDVEYNQPNVTLLDRDNVAIIAKFSLKDNPSSEFVVATTHLLYNPRRLDVRLAQVQVLLTEVGRIARKVQRRNGSSEYIPVIITGDLNSTPETPVYQFIRTGRLRYENTELRKNYGLFGKVLLPPSLRITDSCQHADLEKHKRQGAAKNITRSDELKLIKLRNSRQSEVVLEVSGEVSSFEGHFSTGTLSHPFKLTSVYNHLSNNSTEATTFHHEWITVDYIFYSGFLDETSRFRDDKLKLLSYYSLPTSQELWNVRIPNFELGSDHLALLAKFKLEY